jgi:hypothetical protein
MPAGWRAGVAAEQKASAFASDLFHRTPNEHCKFRDCYQESAVKSNSFSEDKRGKSHHPNIK